MTTKEGGQGAPISGIIYMTTCSLNGKIYIGLHTKGQPWYLGSGKIIKRAIGKYGKEYFTRRIIDEFCFIEEGCAKERMWIEKLNSKSPHGYNLNGGGWGQFNPSVETREKMSLWQRGRGAGRHLSPETRARISASRRGWKVSEKTREKMSAWQKGKRSVSPAYRAKISAAKKGKPWTEARREADRRRKENGREN